MSHFIKLTKILNDVHNILFPPICFGCNAHLIGGEKTLCTICRNQLPLTDYNYNEENPVDRIFYGRVNIKKVNSFLFFTKNGIIKNIIHHLKYKNQEEIGSFFGDWFGQIIKKEGFSAYIDVIIPVPLHKKRLKKRGYNQVALFGKQLAHHLNADYMDNVLIKTANTKTQTKKGRIYRWQQNQNLFELTNSSFLKNKNVLLVDDVITTGATIEACANALHRAENVNIYVATMAVVP
ncbi:ComF family protein [Saonia flava]|uniref:ComF family protein n=1 Tax=Saonia flava TaxID=523696 RepID=A0A846QT46_9FLAO|nr:ComF family protein [Saonia flava]NJB71228.1 ComF family protein [Saonia flava]